MARLAACLVVSLLLCLALLRATPWGCRACRSWARWDRLPENNGGSWMDRVDPCPCTAAAALLAPEKWHRDRVPALHQPCLGGGVDPADEVPGCTAQAFRSARVAENGAGNQCCYGLDGHLITSGLS